MKKHSFLMYLGMLSIFTVVLAGCGATAHIEKDDNVDFRQYKTYSWIDGPAKAKTAKQEKSDLAEARIRSLVSKELADMGWTESAERPDLLLSYDLLVEKSTRERADPRYTRPYTRTFYNPYQRRFFTLYYPSQFMGYDNYTDEVKEGTVTLSMVDTRSDKMVWQGWSTEEINGRHFTSRDLQSGVKAIFRKFDVAKR